MKTQVAFILALISISYSSISSQAEASGILKKAVGGTSSLIAGYWVNHTLEDFTPQCLEEQIPALRAKTYTKTLIKDMITAAAVVTCTLAFKTLIWQKFGGSVAGDGSDVSAPAWLGQAWETGGALGLGLLAYECLGSSLIPDAYTVVKNKVKRLMAKKSANS